MSVEADQAKRLEGAERRLQNRNKWRLLLGKEPFENAKQMLEYEDQLREHFATQK